jgi:hypothetical protein
MSSAPVKTDELTDLQRAVDNANDAVRAYVAEVEARRRQSGQIAGFGGPLWWTGRRSETLAQLQGAYLVAFEALRAAGRASERIAV